MKTKRAKLGMTIRGNPKPNEPEVGTPEFGERAFKRRKRLRGVKPPLRIEVNPEMGKGIRTARGKNKPGYGGGSRA